MRTALLLGWARQSLQEEAGLAREAVHLGLHAESQSALADIAERQRQLDRERTALGLGKLPAFPKDRDLAARHDRTEEFWLYQYAHELVHGSGVGVVFSILRHPEHGMVFDVGKVHPQWWFLSATVAMRSFLLSSRAALGLLDREQDEEIQQLLDAVESVLHPPEPPPSW